jgi:hypothetical protein
LEVAFLDTPLLYARFSHAPPFGSDGPPDTSVQLTGYAHFMHAFFQYAGGVIGASLARTPGSRQATL